MMSDSFMTRKSAPSILISLPDHLPKIDAITGFDVGSVQVALSVADTGTDGDHFAFLRLFLGRIGNDDPALGLGFLLDAADDDAVMQWSERHEWLLWKSLCGQSFQGALVSAQTGRVLTQSFRPLFYKFPVNKSGPPKDAVYADMEKGAAPEARTLS